VFKRHSPSVSKWFKQSLRDAGARLFHGFCDGRGGSCTLHVLFTLVHYESVTSMGFLLFLRFSFVALVVRICDNTYLEIVEVSGILVGIRSGFGRTRSIGPNRPNSRPKSSSVVP